MLRGPDHIIEFVNAHWLVVPIVAPDGRNIGVIQLSDKDAGEFTAADETVLTQLAQLANVAIENNRLYHAAQEAIQLRDAFYSVAAHELKTPLTSLLGQAELLQRRAQREGGLTERYQRSVDVVVSQARRLNAMIQAPLDISRLEHGHLSIERRPVDLGALARQVVEEVQSSLERHTLVYAEQDGPAVVEGDALRLEQVLQNLIGNAVKYSPQGGQVDVRVERRGDRASITVRDRGMGIPEAALPLLFQRFYRAGNVDAQAISGMGIGLYVVREIVSLHGGTVTVESVEGQGSTFTVCLPAASAG